MRTDIQRVREELLGGYFTTRSELRHMAERAGPSFVPVEILEEGEHEALASLRIDPVGDVRVRAVRSDPRQPFRIEEVELA